MYTFLLNEDVRYFERLAGNDTFISFQIVGTATRESIPDVPMFSGNPAKRPRRESLANTLNAVGQTIASALTPGTSSSNEAVVEQV